jgi:hypothetical protein
MRKYFYTDGENQFGPFSEEELKLQKLPLKCQIWYYGLDSWVDISRIPELGNLLKVKSSVDLEKNMTDDQDNKTNKVSLAQKKLKGNIQIFVSLFSIIFIISIGYAAYSKFYKINLYEEIVANSIETNEQFDDYVTKFYRDLEFYGIFPKQPKTKIIKLSRLDQIKDATHIHGISFGINDDDKIEIYINQSTWEQFNKPMRYFLLYHELGHDVLNLEDLPENTINEGKIMYPALSRYENKNMDDFIESMHTEFENHSKRQK